MNPYNLPDGNEPHVQRYIRFIQSRPVRKYQPRAGIARHHILPRSMGGDPGFLTEPNNIIVLTHREHYISHLILWKAYGEKMTTAFWYMQKTLSKSWHEGKLTSKQYETLQIDQGNHKSEQMSGENHHFYGKSSPNSGKFMSEEIKQKHRKPHEKPITEEHRQHMCEAQQRNAKKPDFVGPFKGKHHTEETREILRKPKSEEHKRFIKELVWMIEPSGKQRRIKPKLVQKYLDEGWKLKKKNKKETFFKRGLVLTCPICGKSGSGSTMASLHFDNCGRSSLNKGKPKPASMSKTLSKVKIGYFWMTDGKINRSLSKDTNSSPFLEKGWRFGMTSKRNKLA